MTEAEYTKVSATDCEKNNFEEPKKYGFGVRHAQAFIFFACLSVAYISRAHMGVTIVAMTNVPKPVTNFTVNDTMEAITMNQEHFINSSSNETIRGPLEDDASNNISNTSGPPNITMNLLAEIDPQSKWNVYRTYDWPKYMQETILGAFFLGYFILMFPMGLVCQRWGGKILLQVALFVNGVSSLAIPWLTAWGDYKALCACRAVQGLSQSGIYPSLLTLVANWAPESERSTISSFVYTGSGFGTIMAFQLAGMLADSRWEWPSIFWSGGLLCLIMFTLLTIFGANTPAQHKSITQEELDFIYGHFGGDSKKKNATPWKKILTSKHVWATLSVHIGSGFTFVFFFSQVPTYMHAILEFNIKNSGLLSSIPYILAFFATLGYGYLSDFCTNRKILTLKSARIICSTIASVGSALCISLVSFTQDKTVAVILFILFLCCHTGCHAGFMINYIDLAPNYSGALMAFGNTLCNSMVVILPVIVAKVVTDVTNPFQWRTIFLIMAGVSVISNVFFVLFMSADVQEWNDGKKSIEAEEVKLENHPEKN